MTKHPAEPTGFFKMPLWQQMALGMTLGALFGLAAAPTGLGLVPENILDTVVAWIVVPARLFLALIMMIVMPLVFSSILLSVTGGGSFAFLRTIGPRLVAYFLGTTVFAVLLGIVLSAWLHPAAHMPAGWVDTTAFSSGTEAATAITGTKSIPDMIVGLIPVNPVASLIEQNMLHLVIGGLIAGLALLAVGEKQARPLNDLMTSVEKICLQVVHWAMALAPFAVFGFLFRLAAESGPEAFRMLGAFIGTVLLGLLLLIAFYLLIVALFVRRNPWAFLAAIRDPMVLAFCSSSSAATMPVTLETAENKLNIDPPVARLVVPLGTTINMDGTAFYQMTVALFLTELLGIDLTVAEMVLLSAAIVGAAIGSPGTPGVGLVILATVLTSLGVPPDSIGIILSVDRLLDMCRTVVNVVGDLVASLVMERLGGQHLLKS